MAWPNLPVNPNCSEVQGEATTKATRHLLLSVSSRLLLTAFSMGRAHLYLFLLFRAAVFL